ncbi:Inositol monophosphatase 1 [Microtus ochrogaster]|uniref:Inositol monophosphatase 1 n=1 Tax=Microtus ochrogaster TaxID=79684 RepID=A0A8J6G5B7_MICOH|nr:Inositol monophosphatase 1 [Microtus ochrogaster]
MREYTNFNLTKLCSATDIQAGNSGRSPDVKAGFLEVPALPEGFQGRDFLCEQAPLPPEEPSPRPRQLRSAVRSREMIREALQNEMNVMIKSSPADLVTVTDQNVEKMLLSSIKEKYPSHSFIGEESVAAGEKTVFTDKPTWIIDPIDGTTNFVHRIRSVGTAAVNMCLVATGGADAYYEMGIHCWDMAGAGVIVTEAGGVLMDVTGGPFDLMSRRIIAANSKALAERIAKEIEIIPLQRDDES